MNLDPLIDLRTLSPEILRPIQRWVDDYLAIPRSEQHVRLFGAQFTICRYRRGPLIRYSELMAVYGNFTELSAASENALRQATAALEAQDARDSARARAAFLASLTPSDRALLDAELQSRAKAAAHAAALTAQNEALNARVTLLTAENEKLNAERERLRARLRAKRRKKTKGRSATKSSVEIAKHRFQPS
jgi:hypothetical protein